MKKNGLYLGHKGKGKNYKGKNLWPQQYPAESGGKGAVYPKYQGLQKKLAGRMARPRGLSSASNENTNLHCKKVWGEENQKTSCWRLGRTTRAVTSGKKKTTSWSTDCVEWLPGESQEESPRDLLCKGKISRSPSLPFENYRLNHQNEGSDLRQVRHTSPPERRRKGTALFPGYIGSECKSKKREEHQIS